MENINDKKQAFIHFKSKELCDKFKKKYTGVLGHTCCSGTGVKLVSFNGVEVTTSEQIDEIRQNFK